MHLILLASAQKQTKRYTSAHSPLSLTRAYVPGARHISELMQVPDALLLPLVEAHAPQGIKLESYRWGILESSAADLPRHLEAAARWIDDRHQHGVNVLLYL